MRKQNRQMSEADAWSCFDEALYATLACSDLGQPYQVPLSMARIQKVIYFHCAKEGKKWTMLKNNPHICINAVCNPVVSEENFTMYYRSCTIFGKASFVDDVTEKKAALQAICEKFCFTTKQRFELYTQSAIEQTGIIKIEVREITGKCNPPIEL